MQTEGRERAEILRHLTGVRGAVLMQRLIAVSRVDQRMLRSMISLVSSPSFKRYYISDRRSPQIYQSGWLATGALFHIYFAKQQGVEPVLFNPKVLDQSRGETVRYRQQLFRENRVLRKQFVQMVNRMLDEHQSRLLALKVVRNSGLFEFFPKVQNLFMRLTSEKDRYLRVECVLACTKMVQIPNHVRMEMSRTEEPVIVSEQKFQKQWQEQVQQIRTFLVNIVTEEKYDPQLRIEAYRVCIESKPDQALVRIIINQLMVERVEQVYNYVKRHLDQLSMTQHVCYQSLASRLRPLLTLMTKKTSGLEYSAYQQLPVWLREKQMGAILETDIIYSDKSFTPRRANAKVDLQVLGRNVQVMEIGVHTEGMQTLLEAAFGPDGEVRKMRSSEELLRRSARSIPKSDPLKTEKLRIQPRRPLEEPRLHAYLNMFGYTMAFWEPNTQTLKQIARDGKIDVSSLTGFTIKDKTCTDLLHGHIFMPSPSGFFVEHVTTLSAFNSLTSSMRLPSTPEPSVLKGSLMMQPHSRLVISSQLSCSLQVLRYSTSWATNINLTPNKMSFRWRLDFNKRGDSSSSMPKVELSWTTPQRMVALFNMRNRLENIIENVLYNPKFGVRSKKIVQKLQHRQSFRQVKERSQNTLRDVLKFLGMGTIRYTSQYHSTRGIRNPPVMALMGPAEMTLRLGNTLEESTRQPTMMTLVLEPLNFRKSDNILTPFLVRIVESTDRKIVNQDLLPIDIAMSGLREILKLKLDIHRKDPANWNIIKAETVVANKYDRSNIKTVRSVFLQ